MDRFIPSDLLGNLEEEIRRDQITKVVVGAVILREQRVLLLERGAFEEFGGLVELPSGNVDEGESLLEALAREVREETALVVSGVVRYLGSFDYTSGSGKRARQFTFLVTVGDGNISLNPNEHTEYYWLVPGSRRWFDLNISPEVRSIIMKASWLELSTDEVTNLWKVFTTLRSLTGEDSGPRTDQLDLLLAIGEEVSNFLLPQYETAINRSALVRALLKVTVSNNATHTTDWGAILVQEDIFKTFMDGVLYVSQVRRTISTSEEWDQIRQEHELSEFVISLMERILSAD